MPTFCLHSKVVSMYGSRISKRLPSLIGMSRCEQLILRLYSLTRSRTRLLVISIETMTAIETKQEIKFWEELEHALQDIEAQLNSPEARMFT